MTTPMSQDEEETLRRRISLTVQESMDTVAQSLMNEVLAGKHTREEMTAAIRCSGVWDLEDTWVEVMEEVDRDRDDDD